MRSNFFNRRYENLRSKVREFATSEDGNVMWIGLIMLTTITALGAIVGLSTYRDHVVQQFGDVAVALRNLRQTYKYEVSIDANGNGIFNDREDCLLEGSFSDVVDLVDDDGAAPACMNLAIAPTDER